ncbi:glycosyltransferase family 2 protein [Buttiauxella sp. A111]|uniref:glycosyltransferase family 2 protein n=1 Tax=Buttiauxella sp. A111 TaxID=2563088 RepID=UPI0010EFDF71|nr:glycosyltransferase family 2 protein [Buttiauxella sp. A111]GDX04564.1 glycosyltransferase family 2 protein [Buttiauxella sp. A111]
MISIITPILGTKDKVISFISSLLEISSLEPVKLNDIELIVIDDGSELSLKSTVEFFYAAFLERNWSVKFLRNEVNQGRAYSRNKAAKQASNEWLFFVDIDNLIQPGCLSNLISMIDKNNEPFVARANVRCWPALTKKSNYLHYFDSRYLGNRYKDSVTIDYRYFASDAFIISRTQFNILNGFDESFRHYGCEDEEFGVRLKLFNIRFLFCHDALLFDNDSPTLNRACERMVPYAQYSVPLLLEKHPQIIDSILFPLAEKQTVKAIVVKLGLSILVYLKIHQIIKFILNKLDNKKGVRVASFLYKILLAQYYIDGYLRRKKNG